ncbi:MAG: hypothetical protein ACTSWR_01685 [Candidatus Helarchaeota archaeon]
MRKLFLQIASIGMIMGLFSFGSVMANYNCCEIYIHDCNCDSDCPGGCNCTIGCSNHGSCVGPLEHVCCFCYCG